MDAAAIDHALGRIAREVLDRIGSLEALRLVGIRSRGVPLARRLAAKLGEVVGEIPPVGILDIGLYRDDVATAADHPVLRKTDIPFAVGGARVLLVDDVLFTGRTVRAALDGLIDLGRPRWIQLAVLIDRGHRELPVQADYVGKIVHTAFGEQVEVRLKEVDGSDEVVLVTAAPAPPPERKRARR
jgi:pyrimidine operon attenuation protein/uracil phosphoribosyltransferase